MYVCMVLHVYVCVCMGVCVCVCVYVCVCVCTDGYTIRLMMTKHFSCEAGFPIQFTFDNITKINEPKAGVLIPLNGISSENVWFTCQPIKQYIGSMEGMDD